MNALRFLQLDYTVAWMNDQRECPRFRIEEGEMKVLSVFGMYQAPFSAGFHFYKSIAALYSGRIEESRNELYKSAAFTVCTVAFPIFGFYAPTKTILALDKYRIVDYRIPSWLAKEYKNNGSVDPIADKIISEISWVIDYGIDPITFTKCYSKFVHEILDSTNVAESSKQVLRNILARNPAIQLDCYLSVTGG